MYDALAKGLRRAEGDLIFYLNAGDVLFPGALDVVLDVVERAQVNWLTGYGAIVNADGVVVSMSLPFRYRRSLLRTNAYGSILPTLQQESTFWRAEMMATVDLDMLASYRLAGDHYLWNTFATVAEPTIVKALLGGFTQHGTHLSDDEAGYRAEVARHASRVGASRLPLALIDGVLWRSPDRVKKLLNNDAPRCVRPSECVMDIANPALPGARDEGILRWRRAVRGGIAGQCRAAGSPCCCRSS